MAFFTSTVDSAKLPFLTSNSHSLIYEAKASLKRLPFLGRLSNCLNFTLSSAI